MDTDVGRLFVHCIEIRIIPMFNVIDLRTARDRNLLGVSFISAGYERGIYQISAHGPLPVLSPSREMDLYLITTIMAMGT
jgi:hypothetical protein